MPQVAETSQGHALKPARTPRVDQRGVLIVESPGARELTRRIGEAAFVAELLRLSEVPHYSIEARCESELDLAANVFRAGDFSTVMISSHGASGGIQLTDGRFVGWEELFWKFGFNASHQLVLSACSCFDQNTLALEHASKGPDHAPGYTLGYKTEVSWQKSAMASALLARALKDESETHLRAFYGIYLALNMDVCGVVYSVKNKQYRPFSAKDFYKGTLRDYRDGKCDELFPPLPEESS